MSIAIEDMSEYAQHVVKTLDLEAHPEGGWYRQTWLSRKAVEAGQDAAGDETSESTDAASGKRPLASLIYFLLPEGDASAWHKVDADEIWLWHGPATVGLELGGYGDAPEADKSKRTLITLGQGIAGIDPAQTGLDSQQAGQPSDASIELAEPVAQYAIPEGCWQRTIPGHGDALVSCVVSPGFTFDGFTLE
ncbi:cupin domain-containing protein [Bifidobacterium sp. ESL0763]|uniref:cupin domain-containing protein n=1 Tax=Bifidobacterium sp. ESL0763 TaxID=2983227 RepID=UPI0023F8F313|nr:cupin domain-containing protein [Bifidobacterium sp. ESL0763]MDF7663474.1 cupin domain-containing protein [Bifidobacterium sp. ESL0763]